MAGREAPGPVQRLCQPPCGLQCADSAPPRRPHRMPLPAGMPAQMHKRSRAWPLFCDDMIRPEEVHMVTVAVDFSAARSWVENRARPRW